MASIITLGRKISVRFKRSFRADHGKFLFLFKIQIFLLESYIEKKDIESEKAHKEATASRILLRRRSFSINELVLQTKFTRAEIQFIYKGFKEVNILYL